MRQRKSSEEEEETRRTRSTGITASEEGFNCGEYMFGKRPVLTAAVLLTVTILAMPLVYYLTTKFMYREERRTTHPPLHGSTDDTEVWSLRAGFAEPEHLSIPDLTMFVPDEVVSIDEAHLSGLIHHGAYIFVLDKSKHILLLKRADTMRTCPGAWGLMGEHRRMRETFLMNVRRAVFEETGPKVWGSVNLAVNLTHSPVFYKKDYGIKNGNRKDRQLTSLWLVSLEVNAKQVKIKPDKEMTAFKWVTIAELEAWLQSAPSDFCDESIVSLMTFGLERLKQHPGVAAPGPIPSAKRPPPNAKVAPDVKPKAAPDVKPPLGVEAAPDATLSVDGKGAPDVKVAA